LPLPAQIPNPRKFRPKTLLHHYDSLSAIDTTYISKDSIEFTSGLRIFELSNHLGNVLTTLTDRKLHRDFNLNDTADFYCSDTTSFHDYYPYGMEKPGRGSNPTGYRFGFNGVGADNALMPGRTGYHTYFRQYDTRTARWFSVDPVAHPWQSTYNAMDGNPIALNDPLGAATGGGDPKCPGPANAPTGSESFKFENTIGFDPLAESKRNLSAIPQPGLKPGKNGIDHLIIGALAYEFTNGNEKKAMRMFDLYYEDTPFTIGGSDKIEPVLFAGNNPVFKRLTEEKLRKAYAIYHIISINEIAEVVILINSEMTITIPENSGDIQLFTSSNGLNEFMNTGGFGEHPHGALSSGGEWGYFQNWSKNTRLEGALIIDLRESRDTYYNRTDPTDFRSIVYSSIIESLLKLSKMK
jgi:RHS repeat-associated protein